MKRHCFFPYTLVFFPFVDPVSVAESENTFIVMSKSTNWQKLANEPVPGSASQELKGRVTRTFYMLMARGSGFGDSVLRRTRITEVSLNARINEPTKKEATVVCELDVEEGGSCSEHAYSFIVFKARIVLTCCFLPNHYRHDQRSG